MLFPAEPRINFLSMIMNGANYYYHLYKVAVPPLDTIVLADMIECDFIGYPGGQLAGGWATPTTVDEHAKTAASIVQWARMAGPGTDNTVYGVYVLDQHGLFFGYEPFVVPIVTFDGMPPIQYIPVLTFAADPSPP